MPSFDHIGDAANDLAFTRGMVASEAGQGTRYVRRRIAATVWIPAFIVAVLLGTWAQSWELAVGLMVVIVVALVVYAEGAGRITSWVRRAP